MSLIQKETEAPQSSGACLETVGADWRLGVGSMEPLLGSPSEARKHQSTWAAVPGALGGVGMPPGLCPAPSVCLEC